MIKFEKKKNFSLPSQRSQIAALGDYICKDDSIANNIQASLQGNPSWNSNFVIFLSVCNIKERAGICRQRCSAAAFAYSRTQI